jgi:hypothetical protein
MLMIMMKALQYVLHLYNIPVCNLLLLSLGEEERMVLGYPSMQIKQIVLRKLQGNISAVITNNLHQYQDLHYCFLNE